MLVIENINNIVGHTAYGRKIVKVSKYFEESVNKSYYIFHFASMGDGKDWNAETEVRLGRDKMWDGTYELFVMGLHRATVREIRIGDIRSEMNIITEIGKCMTAAKFWWDTKAVTF